MQVNLFTGLVCVHVLLSYMHLTASLSPIKVIYFVYFSELPINCKFIGSFSGSNYHRQLDSSKYLLILLLFGSRRVPLPVTPMPVTRTWRGYLGAALVGGGLVYIVTHLIKVPNVSMFSLV